MLAQELGEVVDVSCSWTPLEIWPLAIPEIPLVLRPPATPPQRPPQRGAKIGALIVG